MMAELWHVANQPSNERAELENCVKNYPNDPEAYLILADFSFAEGRTAAAEALFNRAAQLDREFQRERSPQTRFPDTASPPGWRQWPSGAHNGSIAKKYLESWLALDPDSAAGHARLGRVLFQRRSIVRQECGARQAYEQFQIAAKADDKSISPDLALALLFEEAKAARPGAKNSSPARSRICRRIPRRSYPRSSPPDTGP